MKKYLPSRETAKAVAAALVALAAYLVGVLPATAGLGDVTTVQWLGAIVFLGGAYGITYRVANKDRAPAPGVSINTSGLHIAGPGLVSTASVKVVPSPEFRADLEQIVRDVIAQEKNHDRMTGR